MSYGNCKPNVLAKTVTVMTAVCRKVTVRPLVKCIRRMKRIGAQGQVPWFTLSCWRTCLCDSRKECHHLAYNESYIQSSRCLFRNSWFRQRRQGGFMVNPVTLIIIPEIWVQAVSGIYCNYAPANWVLVQSLKNINLHLFYYISFPFYKKYAKFAASLICWKPQWAEAGRDTYT